LLSMPSKKPLHLLARQPASRKSRRIAQAKAWAIDFQITRFSLLLLETMPFRLAGTLTFL
jgi:hypothetical protein